MKTCSKCLNTKHFSEFTKDRTKNDGFYSSCKVCKKIKETAFRSNNPKYMSEWYKSNSTRLKEASRQWRLDNPERAKYQMRRWNKNNPEKAKANKARYRAMKQLVDENYTKYDEQYTRDRFCHECFNCGSAKRLEIDHHFPLSKGYALTKQNAVVLCKYCNCSKQGKMPCEFYNEHKLKTLDWLLKI